MRDRKLLTRRSAALLLGLLLLCVLVFWIFSRLPGGTEAVVERDGQELFRQKLSRLSGPETVQIDGENGIALTVVFYPDGAAVTSSQCPDKICVHTGKLTKAGETAICLPAKVVLRLEGPSETDAEL